MRYDFHGVKLEEVDKIFDTLINNACNYRDPVIHIITGTGVIKDRVKYLSKEYGYEITEELGNPGAMYLDLDS